jgi:hypothetical protein
MAGVAQDSFFDVLIDRLIVDVKRDFEASLRDQSSEQSNENAAHSHDSIFDEPAKSRPPSLDDLVSKMIGFRSRLETSRMKPEKTAMHSIEAPKKFDSRDIEIGTARASRKKATPRFSSSDGEVAFAIVTKSGAQFYVEDMVNDEISRDALKRERRRVLLTLHPDRVPETDRARAHNSFLEAAEAFSVLAESFGSRQAA